MNKRITEEQVLKTLGIPDFRHMTKEKIIQFISVLPYMDPEVAKKALEQFPEFKDLMGTAVIEYKSIIIDMVESNSESQNVRSQFIQSATIFLILFAASFRRKTCLKMIKVRSKIK